MGHHSFAFGQYFTFGEGLAPKGAAVPKNYHCNTARVSTHLGEQLPQDVDSLAPQEDLGGDLPWKALVASTHRRHRHCDISLD